MDRREFVQFSVTGAAGLALPLWACGDGNADVSIQVEVSQGYLIHGPDGRVFVLEPLKHRISVRASADGHEIDVIGSLGTDGAHLNNPVALDFDAAGNLYVADRGNSRVQVYSADGAYLRQIGRPGTGDDELSYPADLIVDRDHILVADTLNHRVQIFATDGTHLGQLGAGELNGPRSLARDNRGNLHVVDGGNRRVAVFDASGRLQHAYAGRGLLDSGVELPRAIAIDSSGNSFVADVSTTSVYRYDRHGALAGSLELTLDDGQPASPIYLGIGADDSLLVTAIPGYAD